MSEPIVRLQGLKKQYGTVLAVQDLTLEIQEGEIFAFLGPNGSGKTTTFLMMMGLTTPSGGDVHVCGYHPAQNPIEVKRVVSHLPDNLGFYEDLTAAGNLRYTGALAGVEPEIVEHKIEKLLRRVLLYNDRDKPVGQFSRGMKQRLGIADVLIKNPRLVILDEPTLGLDPDGAKELLAMIHELSREQGITVLLSSHQLEHVQQISDRIAIFKKGEMKACGSIHSLAQQMQAGETECCSLSLLQDGGFLDFVRKLEPVAEASAQNGGYRITYARGRWQEIAAAMANGGYLLTRLGTEDGNLREIYRHFFVE